MGRSKKEIVPPPEVGKKVLPDEVKPVAPSECCGTCKFYIHGWCRRFPQSMTKDVSYWCGEYVMNTGGKR